MSVNLLLCGLYQFEDPKASNEAKVDCLQFMDLLVDRIREVKYKEKVELKVKGVKVRFKLHPKGESLGAALAVLCLNQLRLLYLANFAIQDELHVQGIPYKLLVKQDFDFVLTTFSDGLRKRRELKDCLERSMRLNGKTVLIVDQIPRLFELVFSLNELFFKTDGGSAQVVLPQTYRYYVDCVKRLSEYMPTEISQNLTIGEDDLFRLKFVAFEDSRNRRPDERVAFYVATAADFLIGRVFQQTKDFKDFDLVFADAESRSAYYQIINDGNREGGDQMALEKVEGSEGSETVNRLVGVFTAAVRDEVLEAETRVAETVRPIDDENDSQDVFFSFKNHDVFFHFPKIERPTGDYGSPLTELELSVMEYMDPAQSSGAVKDQGVIAIQQEMTKTKDFFEKYVEFANRTSPFVHSFHAERTLDFHWAADLKDEILLLTQLSATRVLALNEPSKEALSTYACYQRSFSQLPQMQVVGREAAVPVSQQALSVNFHPSELDNLQFRTINDDVKFVRINFSLQGSPGAKLELKVKPIPSEPLYRITKSCKLMNIREFMASKGLVFKLEVRRLNLNGKVFIVSDQSEFRVEGLYSEEYFKVRQLLYQFINL